MKRKAKVKKVDLHVKIDPELKDLLDKYSRQKHRPRTVFVEDALWTYLDKKSKIEDDMETRIAKMILKKLEERGEKV